ncbi:protein-tyrosine phosphatase domain-containing protein [Ditylenchus destructor]|nr:protein-tyrosine phosphatase domain-containing protein [Ditylenchus destructor]
MGMFSPYSSSRPHPHSKTHEMLRMPLKLKFGKKSGSYELSQEIYVLCIFVGEYQLIQCTLTTESTARQCMHYLCEKIDLSQAEMFGFRFQMRFNDPDRKLMRWVELDKPLRRQLEKWACKPRQVQLAILYHTPNVFSLHDQVARSLYYMLLKLDVLSGKYNIDLDKYIDLAAYSLQVENDFDASIHSLEYLRTLKLLPPHIYRNSLMVDDTLVKILRVHERLSGMQPSYAAFHYIVNVQQCEGYGEECFSAKDDESTEVKLGYSLEEIFVKRYNGSTLKYKWADIKEITTAKRNLTIKDSGGNTTVFSLEDVDMTKYVHMVFNWQFKFAVGDAIQQKSVPMSINNLQGGIRTFGTPQPLMHRHSNADVHSTRTTNSIDMGMSGISTNGVCMHHQACSSSSSNLLINRVNTSSLYNINAAQNGVQNGNNCQSTVHSVQSFSHPPISATLSVNCNRSITTSQVLLPPSVSTPTLTQNTVLVSSTNGNNAASPVYRPSAGHIVSRPPALSLPQATPNSLGAQADAEWIQAEQKEILKKLVEQKLKKSVGSSPEIHLLGTGNGALNAVHQPNTSNYSRNAVNSHLMRRVYHPRGGAGSKQRTTNYSDEKSPLHPATFNYHKWCSTPDLLSTNVITAIRQNMTVASPAPPSRHPLVHRESSTTTSAASSIHGGSSTLIHNTRQPLPPKYAANIFPLPPPPTHSYANANSIVHRNSENLRVITDQNSVGNQIQSLTPPNSAPLAQNISQGTIITSSGVFPITYPIPTEAFLPNRTGVYTNAGSQSRLPIGSPSTSRHNNETGVKEKYLPFGACQYSFSNACNELPPPYEKDRPRSPPTIANAALGSAGASLISSMEEEEYHERTPERTSSRSSEEDAVGPSIYAQTLNIENPSLSTAAGTHRFQQLQKVKEVKPMIAEAGSRNVLLNGVMMNHVANGSNGQYPKKSDFFVSQDSTHNASKSHQSTSKTKSPEAVENSTTLDEMLLGSLNAKLAVPQAVEMEFAGIPGKRLSAGFSTSQYPHNQPRNREGKVFPYEDTRVMLTPHKRNNDGYINASNVQVPIGDHRWLKYIVTQAPIKNTIDDFWQMVWESGARVIVMLVNPHQIQKSDTIPTYWPSKTKERLNFGSYFIKLISSSTSKFQTTSVLSLKSVSRGERRTIYHLYCADFAEDGVPSSEDSFMGFIDAVNSVKRHIENERRETDSANYRKGSAQSRSRSIGRRNLSDVTNRLRAQSVETSNSGGAWKKKLSFGISASNSTASSSNSDNHPCTTPSHSPSNPHRHSNSVASSSYNGGGQSVFYTSPNEDFGPLTIVHCTDGAAESGVYVLVEVLIRCIESNVNVEIAQVLRSLRQQRMCLVKNASQYRFVYQLIIGYLQKSRLI